MSFNKQTTFKINGDDLEIMSYELVKTASFKLPDGFTHDSDYLYLKVKAVSAGEFYGSNKNDDYFPEQELKENYKSFLVAHTFKNHENKKIENAIGDVLSADWSDRMKCVYLTIRVDKRIAPSIVRGYEKGFMTDVSMGCRVDHVVCSYCGQKAKTRFDYCDHLKTMKGKVMDNGKKVYEINIKPKFHDISAVLNGAERTAKVEGIYVNNSKIAISMSDKSLEKVASYKSKFSSSSFIDEILTNNNIDSDIEVIASSMKEDSKTNGKDISKSKKDIDSKIKNKACLDLVNRNHEIFSKISDSIKYNFTKFWDRETCISYGRTLRDIAKNSSVPPEQVFITFLKILDANMIELSALEIHDIFFETFNFDSHDIRKIKFKNDEKNVITSSSFVDKLGIKNLSGSVNIINKLRGLCDRDGISTLGEHPIPKMKILIMKSRDDRPVMQTSVIDEIMSKIVKSVLSERSNKREFLNDRLIKIANDEHEIYDNSAHFSLDKISKLKNNGILKIACDMANILYSSYQNERIESLNDGSLYDDMQKVAFYDNQIFNIEKTAGKRLIGRMDLAKASLMGFPVAMAYGGIQRARINNGEDVSSLNRFVAENPVSAGLVATALTKSVGSGINKYHKKAKYITEDVADAISNKFNKVSSESIFSDKNIDDKMKQQGYSGNDIITLKQAAVLAKSGEESSSECLLLMNKLAFDDVDNFLNTASIVCSQEFEKIAGNMLGNIAKSVGSDVIFDNVKKGSGLAMLPGYVADGLIFTSIGKGLQKASKKKKEGIVNE